MREAGSLRERLAGVTGTVLIGSLFVPWAEVRGGDASAFDLMPGGATVCVVAGLTAIFCAVTKGRVGFFRPDVSVGGAADILSVAAAVAITWLLLFELPEGASASVGIYLALGAACATFTVVGDPAPFRGAPVFPRLAERGRSDDLR